MITLMIMIMTVMKLPRIPSREMRAGGMADTQRPVTSPNTEEVTISSQKCENLPRQESMGVIRSDVRCEENLH